MYKHPAVWNRFAHLREGSIIAERLRGCGSTSSRRPRRFIDKKFQEGTMSTLNRRMAKLGLKS